MNPEQNNQNQGSQSSNSENAVPNFTKNNNSTVIAALSYIGPLVLIPYLMNNDSDFVKFHAKQGLVVFGIEVIFWILSSMMYSMFSLYYLGQIINLATLILSIIGIINVVQNQKKELPLVGGFAKSFNL